MRTPMMNRTLRWMVSAILVAALVSCSDDPAEEVGPVDPTTSLNTETGDPSPESPTENPTISLPSLPIGGNASDSEDVPNNQCVDVNWIAEDAGGAELREGIEVVITGFSFTPELFVETDTGCSDNNPPCTGYVFSQDAQVCNLAVAPLPGAELLEDEPFVAANGNVTCTLTAEECQAFAEAVSEEQNLTIPLLIPVAAGG